MSGISRREARECALKNVYAFSIAGTDNPGDFFELNCAEQEIASDDFSYELYMKTVLHFEDIDKLIEENSKGWKVSRISKITLSILRMCICEFLYFDDIPGQVSMNEAVELAKKYDDDDAPSFVNGVVNAVYKGLKK